MIIAGIPFRKAMQHGRVSVVGWLKAGNPNMTLQRRWSALTDKQTTLHVGFLRLTEPPFPIRRWKLDL